MSKHLKILLGGSPCTYWSISQSSDKRETTASGIGWELFKNYLYARDKFKPDYFLYENNKSAAQPIKDQISKELGVNLQYINSALVSAQNRQRFYCHNIPGVPQPQDRGILLRDVLDSGVPWNEKAYCIDSNYYKGGNLTSFNKQSGQRLQVAEPIRIGSLPRPNGELSESQAMRIYSVDGKSVTQSAQGGGLGAKTGLYAVPINDINGKARTIRATCYKDGIRNLIANNIDKRTCVAEPIEPLLPFTEQALCETADKTDRKSICLDGDSRKYIIDNYNPNFVSKNKKMPIYQVLNGLITIKDKQYPIKLPDGFYIIRKLTVKECCRLQTFPDNWFIRQDGTQIVSNSQAYKQLGNSWTVEVSKHILSFIPNISECTVEVLSMYDGISAGQLSLEQLGAKIVSYKATEIDKYCIQTTQYHFPKTIQLGDAFQVRENNWRY